MERPRKKCPLFRRPESLNMGKGIGYCDLDSNAATCEGDIKYCENPDALARFLRKRIESLRQEREKTSLPS